MPVSDALAVADVSHGHLDGREAAIPVAQPAFKGGAPRGRNLGIDRGHIFRRDVHHHVAQMSAHEFAAHAAEQLAVAIIHFAVASHTVHTRDAVAGCGKQGTVACVATAHAVKQQAEYDAAGDKPKDGQPAAPLFDCYGILRRQKQIPDQHGRNEGGADTAPEPYRFRERLQRQLQ